MYKKFVYTVGERNSKDKCISMIYTIICLAGGHGDLNRKTVCTGNANIFPNRVSFSVLEG